MIYEAHLFKLLYAPHVSEKTSIAIEKNNTVVLKVVKKTTKIEIKKAVENLFKVHVKHVNTLVIKGKAKRKANRTVYSSSWKKAYIILKKGQNVNFLDK